MNFLINDLLAKTFALLPTLSQHKFYPILSHICFDGDILYSFNDVVSIQIPLKTRFHVAVPGKQFYETLNSFSDSKDKIVKIKIENSSMLLESGNTELTLPILGKDSFIYDRKIDKDSEGFLLNDQFIDGIKKCLISVGRDPSHPAQMGITLSVNTKGEMYLYSTNNFTISRYFVESIDNGPLLDIPVFYILPEEFCINLIKLYDKDEENEAVLSLSDTMVSVDFSSGVYLSSKFIINVNTLDFDSYIKRAVPEIDKINNKLVNIPDGFEQALKRSSVVKSISEYFEESKDTFVSLEYDGSNLIFVTDVGISKSEDVINLDMDIEDIKFNLDINHLLPVLKELTHMYFGSRAFVGSDGECFTFFVSHSI